jgi:hypothetical protein
VSHQDPNPRAVMGDNNPPPDQSETFLAVKAHVDDYMTEARNWTDGQAIENQAQADVVARLINQGRDAIGVADEARKEEAAPFDRKKAEIQERYGVWIADTTKKRGSLVLAVEALKKTLQPWLKKLAAEQAAREQAAREEAERQALEAQRAREAAAATPGDLGAAEAAQAATQAAEDASKGAKAAARAVPQAGGGEAGRRIGLRTEYRVELVDPAAAVKHYAKTQGDRLRAFLVALAEADVRAGKRAIPGMVVHEEKVAV